jgi:hypothetical protein
VKGLLVRVAADQSEGGGNWNGPVDSETGEFVYVSIPDDSTMRAGLEKPCHSYLLLGCIVFLINPLPEDYQ